MTEIKEPLIVDVDLKESDLQRANFWFRLGNGPARLYIAILLVAGLLILWRFGTANVFDNPPIATVIVVALIMPVLYPLLIWYQTKRGFANLQGFQRTIQYSFSSDGYSVRDAKSSADINWDVILRAAESKHSFNLFFHKSLFHTIPKRCFKHPDDIVRLRDFLKHSLGTKAAVA